MEIEEYEKYLENKSKVELLGIEKRIDKAEHADRFNLVRIEIQKRESGIEPVGVPITTDGTPELSTPYAGFWKRLGAYLVDLIILLPLVAVSAWGAEQSRMFFSYFCLPSMVLGLWFHAYLVKQYGGTPGKLLMKIRIRKLYGQAVGYQEALIRYSVLMLLTVVMSAASIVVTLSMSDELYFSLAIMERTQYINENKPGWYSITFILMNIWVWSEFIIMLTNKKRRAIHDYMAGTVVVHVGSEHMLSNKANQHGSL